MTATDYTTDTTAEAYQVQLDCLRRMSPDDRIRKMCQMSARVKRMAFDAIRRRHPDFDEAEVRMRFLELAYGKALADDVRAFQKERGIA